MKVIVKIDLVGGRESGMVAGRWKEALKNTRNNFIVRQEANNFLTILTTSYSRPNFFG
jgi:hypothetical protein